MNVLVVGATGKIGYLTVLEALRQGHNVTAFGRAIERIAPAPNLRIVRGDVSDPKSVASVIHGHDVAVLGFGAIPNFRTLTLGTDVCEVGTRHVIGAMKAAGTKRLIAMTSIGAGNSAGHGRWLFRAIIKPVILGRIMKDRSRQEELVRASGLAEWVIVRPAELNDGSRSEDLRYFSTFDGKTEPSVISRASVAAFLAKSITDQSYDYVSVLISN
jgi:putative NADH-flavin reductase